MSICIGWFLDDDHDFDTLMVTTLIGSVILFLLSLSTNVQPADVSLLDIIQCPTTSEDLTVVVDESSPFLTKQQAYTSFQQQEPTTTFIYYKPYSLFGEHLSNISEEDASMVQRMTTTHSTSIRPLPANSIQSSSSRMYRLPYTPPISCNNHNIPIQFVQEQLPASFELARLPYPPPEAPSLVLITFFPGYYQKQTVPPVVQPQEEEYYYLHCYQQQSRWILKSFMSSLFCLGVVFGLTQSLLFLYVHDTLQLPMHFVGVVGFMMVCADLLASEFVLWVSKREKERAAK